MIFIDTHAHLYTPQFDADRTAMVRRAIDSGIQYIFMPNIDNQSIEGMLALETEFPTHCFPMMGLHPCSVKDDYLEQLSIVEDWLDKRAFSAIGEMGIDLYWDKTHIEAQKDAFLRQCALGVQYDLPIVIHSREATGLCLELLASLSPSQRPKGVFHCFGGSLDQAKAAIDLGFYLGIGGVVTFKNGGLKEILPDIDLDYLGVETDSPYLAPHPHRGKRNESYFIHQIAATLASTLEKEIAEIARITTRNARQLFAKSFEAQ